MVITNTYKKPLGLPGVTLHPGVPTPVHNWEELRKNHVVAAWVKAKVLVESEGSFAASTSKLMLPDKADICAKLDALQVPYTKQSGVPKLMALLSDAKDSLRKEAQVRALNASGLSAEDWTNQADDIRDAQTDVEYQKMITALAQA